MILNSYFQSWFDGRCSKCQGVYARRTLKKNHDKNCVFQQNRNRQISFEFFKRGGKKVNSSLHQIAIAPQKDLTFHGMFVCITGMFQHVTRKTVEDVVSEKGGKVMERMTKEVNLLLVGDRETGLPKGEITESMKKIEAKKQSLEIWNEEVLVKKLGITCKEDCCAEKKTDNNNLAEERRDCIATDMLAPCEEEYLDVNDNVGKDVDKKIQDEGDGPSGLMEEE